MSDDAVESGARYWAFVSYSHKDADFGRHLHRRLEAFSLPRRLVGRVTPQGTIPKRLVPIFRDRDELPAANDLSTEVRAALQASRSLIVVCSRAAAASRWVSREVEEFRSLHPNRPILAALVDGEPSEGFPEALQRRDATGKTIEPLAADFRASGDGDRLALLKLVAGIVGIGLDELIQRDAQRRMQRVTAVTATAITAMLAMGVLTAFALNARSEAERQRGEAEGLVEFMLTDLRTRLKGVGRLDVMDTVNERALRYYTNQQLDSLPPASLERRARVLHAMGEDDETRGDHEMALAKFQEARRTTAALLAAAPDDPERIFNQAQSEFWIGFVYYERHEFKKAKTAFGAYKTLADRLLAVDPDNPRFLREAGYAQGNLCSVALKPPEDPKAAVELCSAALKHMEAATARLGTTDKAAWDLANRHAWLADAYHALGDDRQALAERLVQEEILDKQIQADPKNMNLKYFWVALQRILAWMEAESGEQERALVRIRKTIIVSDQMVAFDPSNEAWKQQRAKIAADAVEIAQMHHTTEEKQQ